MGRKGWTSDKQFDWLKEHIPQYRDAQSQRKLADFKEKMIAAFFRIFRLVFIGSGDDTEEAKKDEDVVLAPDLQMAQTVRPHIPLITMRKDF